MKDRLIQGVGVFTKGKYHSKVNGASTREYRLWSNMLMRTDNLAWKNKYPAYKDCIVSDNFKDFQFFAEWCNNQIGFKQEDWQLDKDILVRGNKKYSEDICVFIPRKLNGMLNEHSNERGAYPIGVYYDKDKSKFTARVRKGGNPINLGRYLTVEEAYLVYKEAKEVHVKEMAEYYKDQIDPRVYKVLSNWELPLFM